MAADRYVTLEPLTVLTVRADLRGPGPASAFRMLESKLPTLTGRKFYGMIREPDEGEYYACVVRRQDDDPARMGLEVAELPGGLYARRRLPDWESHTAEIRTNFQQMVMEEEMDTSRPSLEYYRSQRELQLLVPVLRKREPPSH